MHGPRHPTSRSSKSSPKSCDTCAILVTFNPDAGFPERLRRLLSQFPGVFVIDNASSIALDAMLRDAEGEGRIHLLRNRENLGIAKALNRGLEEASNAGFTWAVTFDQDTTIFENLLDALLEAAHVAGAGDVLVGANYFDMHRNRIARHVHGSGREPCPRKTLITSGMLLPIRFALRIGGFREDYFIDSVDHEFCLRAAANDARVLMTREPLMEHRIGQPGVGMRCTLALSSNHPPMRKYYIARNTLLTVREYAWVHPAWALRQLSRLAAEMLSIACFESDRKPKIAAFTRGLRDGITNRGGRAP